MDRVQEFLKSAALSEYESAFEETGYDSLPHILHSTPKELDEIADDVNMKKGHRRRFKNEISKLATSQKSSSRANPVRGSGVSLRTPLPDEASPKMQPLAKKEMLAEPAPATNRILLPTMAPPTRVGSKSKSCKPPPENDKKESFKDVLTLQDKVRQTSNRSPDKYYLQLYRLDLERQLAMLNGHDVVHTQRRNPIPLASASARANDALAIQNKMLKLELERSQSLIQSQNPQPRTTFEEFLNNISAGVGIQNFLGGCPLTGNPVTGKLLGRKSEIQHMLAALSRKNIDNKPQAVQTAAPSGSGKSALLQELVRIFSSGGGGHEHAFSSKRIKSVASAATTADKNTNAKTKLSFDPDLLSSLFPIPITFNYATRFENTMEGEMSIQSSLAVRVAFSVFEAHKAKSNDFLDINPSFESFLRAWNETDEKPDDILREVLMRVQNMIGDQKNILLFVDEAQKRGSPEGIRSVLFNQWFLRKTRARLVMTSLHPGHLGSIESDEYALWVQLTRGDPDVVESICNSDAFRWLKEKSSVAFSKQRALLRFLLNMCGNNWRARAAVYGLLKERPVPPNQTTPLLNNVAVGMMKVSAEIKRFFFSERHEEWVQAVNELLVDSVLRRKVKLVHRSSKSTTKKAGKDTLEHTPASWLLKGLLSNPVPIVSSNQPNKYDIPEIPLAIIHQWQEDPGSVPAEVQHTHGQIAPFVQKIWESSNLFFTNPAEKAWKRYEGVISYWFGLLLHCSFSEKRNLVLCSHSSISDVTVLFENFTISTDQTIQLQHPSQFLSVQKRVIQLPYKISGPKAADIPPKLSCNGCACAFICKDGEDAIDLFIYIDKRLILVQSKLYADPISKTDLKDMLKSLRVFRGKLWSTVKGRQPDVARILGIPTINEDDVVFVLLATAGVVDTAETANATCVKKSFCSGKDGFSGILVMPGNKRHLRSTTARNPQHFQNFKLYNHTWLDSVLGPTFGKLVHALRME